MTRRKLMVCALLATGAAAQTGCAALTGTFEATGVHWSDGGSWKEVTPLRSDTAPVGAVLVDPQGARLTCYRTPEAHVVGYSARYSTIFKVLAGFMFVGEGSISATLLASDNVPTGGRIAGAIVGVDALATLGLMLFKHQKIERVEQPPPQFTVVAVCPRDTAIVAGDRSLGVDEHGSFGNDAAALADALTARASLHLRVAGRTVPVPLSDAELGARSPVLVVLERPSFVVPWPVETAQVLR